MVLLTLIDYAQDKAYELEVTEEVAKRARDDPMFATNLLEQEMERQVQEHSGTSVTPDVPSEGCPAEDTLETPDDDGFRWGHEAILLLVETFREEEHQFSSKKLPAKKVWEKIAAVMRARAINVTGGQVKSKINGLKKTYKSIKDANGRSGSGRRTWPYLNLMDSLFGEKPWVAPVLALESDAMPGPSRINTVAEQAKDNTRKRSREDSVVPLVEALRESREERRRQHNELLARQDRYLALLQQLVEK